MHDARLDALLADLRPHVGRTYAAAHGKNPGVWTVRSAEIVTVIGNRVPGVVLQNEAGTTRTMIAKTFKSWLRSVSRVPVGAKQGQEGP